MTKAYLALGSNLGSRARNLGAARRRLREHGARVLRQSRVIESEPWGVTDQPKFLNQVIEIEWSGTARQLLRVCKLVEREGGRRPSRRWGPRIIDVDIVLFGDERISEPDLHIPHPHMTDRPFVYRPLRELGVRTRRASRS